MHIDTMAKRAKQVGFVATAITSAVTARFGWLQGEDVITSIVYAVGLGLASFMVGYGLVFAWESRKRNMPAGVTIASVAIFAIAVIVEVLSHVGANASARSHDMARATEQTNAYADTRNQLDQARADLAAIRPTRAPAAVSADMARIEGAKWFSNTSGCTNPNPAGSGRGYGNSCNKYNVLKGELATAQNRMALAAKIDQLAGTSATSSAGHSVALAQTKAVASYATWNTNPGADDQAKTNMAITLILALYFVSLGLVNLVAQAFDPEDGTTTAAQPSAEIVRPQFRKPSTPVVDDLSWAKAIEQAQRKIA